MNSMNSNQVQSSMNPSSDFINQNEIAALQILSQLPQSALSALTQLAASGFSTMNSSVPQNSVPNINSTPINIDQYSNTSSMYANSINSYSNYQPTTGIANMGSASSQFSGKHCSLEFSMVKRLSSGLSFSLY